MKPSIGWQNLCFREGGQLLKSASHLEPVHLTPFPPSQSAMPTAERIRVSRSPQSLLTWLAVCMVLLLGTGCGTTAQRGAMEQLLVSDAVDQAIARIDFTPLAGQTVYLKSDYIRNVKQLGFVNAEYVISALRHRVITSGCLLKDNMDEADIILEPRVGTLGSDEYNITYGLPRSDAASSIATLASNSPISIPALPELAISKSEYRQGVAKVNVFAYRRDDQSAVWQSGVAKSTSTSRDIWILGAGPIQRGTVYDGTQFAGSRLKRLVGATPKADSSAIDQSYRTAKVFEGLTRFDTEGTRLASEPEPDSGTVQQ